MKEAIPFAAAIVFYAMTPYLNWRAKSTILGWIEKGQQHSGTEPADVPDYASPKQISDYIDYTADLLQIYPGILLTVVGLLVAAQGDLPTTIVAALSFSVLAAVVTIEIYVESKSSKSTWSQNLLSAITPVSGSGITQQSL
jgi:hypothetical protein